MNLTIAESIKNTCDDTNDAIQKSDANCIDSIQDWGNETSIFIFTDDSVLTICNTDINAYKNFQEFAK